MLKKNISRESMAGTFHIIFTHPVFIVECHGQALLDQTKTWMTQPDATLRVEISILTLITHEKNTLHYLALKAGFPAGRNLSQIVQKGKIYQRSMRLKKRRESRKFSSISRGQHLQVFTLLLSSNHRLFIPDPGYWFLPIPYLGSWIPDLKNSNERQGWKKLAVIPFFWSHKFHKIELFYFWNVDEKIWANFQRIIELFTQKIVTKLSKIWVWDPGVKKAPDPGSGSATLN
jgi:hypothetical protein